MVDARDTAQTRHAPPLVGRAAEVAALERALERGDAAALVVEIAGEAGIGKTRLLGELRALGEACGRHVFAGRAAELERDIPFGPVIDALDDYLAAQPRDRFARLSAEQLGELAGIFPALAPYAPPVPPTAQSERYRAHRAVRALLEDIAVRRPVVLALDDLHWADEASLELVSFLLRRPPRAPVVLALAHRPAQAPPLLRAALGTAGAAPLERLAPAPLTEADVGALVGPHADPALTSALHRESGGNPFFLEQLLRAGGSAVRAGGGSADGAPDLGVPAAVLAALDSELMRLTPDARALLRGAAVAGEPFEPETAAAAAEVDVGAALGLLDELAAAELVRPTEVPRRFRFRHPIVRRAVYEGAPPGWRLAAHGRVAAALERAGAPAVARAHHVERAARPGDRAAIDVLAEAGSAAAALAPASAAHWYGAALRLLPADDQARRLDLLVPRAVALGSAGRLEESRTALLEALALLPDEAAERRAEVVTFLGGVEHQLGRHAQAAARNLSMLRELGDRRSRAAVALRMEVLADALHTGDVDDAVDGTGREALAAARELGDRALAARAAVMVAFACAYRGRFEEAERLRGECARLVDGLEDRELMPSVDTAYYLGAGGYFLERFEDAARHLARGVAVSRASGQGQFLVPLRCMLAFALVELGRLDEAAEVIDAAEETARLSGNPQALFSALTLVAWTARATGDTAAATAATDEGARLARGAEESLFSRAFHAHVAAVWADLGDPERALAELELAGPPGFEGFEPGRRALWTAVTGRALLALGRTDEAAEVIGRAAAKAAGLPLPVAVGRVAYARAELALARGEPAAAADLALGAAERHECRSARIEEARARLLGGRALAAAGDAARAAGELERAHAVLAVCGAVRWCDEAAQELRRLGRRVRRRPRGGGGPGALSGRELEVARLVVEGRTNREIAAALFVSEKTVEKHLSRIFEKLGVARRTQLAARVGGS